MSQPLIKAGRADMRATGLKSNHPKGSPDGRFKIPKRAKNYLKALSQEQKHKLKKKWKHLPRASWSQTLSENIKAAAFAPAI